MAPAEWAYREILWNAVEEAEKTKDSRLARGFFVALLVELSQGEWIALLTNFIQNNFSAEGMCAAVSLCLERFGHEERIDHRSHAERGLDE